MTILKNLSRVLKTIGVCGLFAAAPAIAEQDAAAPQLIVELNAAQTLAEGCSLSFLITSGLPDQIDTMVLEAVLFDTGGQVAQLTLFDFGTLPAGRPRVRQFVVPGKRCDSYTSVLINGVQSCEMAGAASSLCEQGLELRTRSDIDLIG